MREKLFPLYKWASKLARYYDTRFTSSGRTLLALCIISVFFALNSERSMFYQLFPLLFLLLCTGFIFSLRFKTPLTCTRSFPKTCVAGQKLKYNIIVENPSNQNHAGIFFKEWVQSPLPKREDFRKSLSFPSSGKSWFARKLKYSNYQALLNKSNQSLFSPIELPIISAQNTSTTEAYFTPKHRGYVHIDGYIIYRKDPLGLFKKQIKHQGQTNILVLPKLYPAPQLQFDGSRKYHQGGINAAMSQGDSEEFVSLREYKQGDPLKSIDWKGSAKAGHFIVKQFKNEYFSRFGLILDTFSPVQESPVFESAISIAASLLMAQNTNENVLDLLFVGNKCYTETVGKGLSEQQHMLKILACINPCLDFNFSHLTNLIKDHSDLLSGLTTILIDIDNDRLKLLEFFTESAIPHKIILVCESKVIAQEKLNDMGVKKPIFLVQTDSIAQQLGQL